MEIKLNLKLETLLSMLTFVENMDMETFALIAVAVMMIPFVIYSLWSLTFALICQLFWLGVKGGLVLMTVCSMIMAVLKFSTWRPGGAGARALGIATVGEVNCTMMDVVLTVLFQAGVRVPSGIWNGLMDNFVKNSGGGGDVDVTDGLSKITKKKDTKRTRGKGKKSAGSSSTQSGVGSEGEMSAEDNLDGIGMEVFEDVGASGDYVPPRSAEEAIIKGILMDEDMLSSDATSTSASGETGGTRRKTRGGRKRTRNNNSTTIDN